VQLSVAPKLTAEFTERSSALNGDMTVTRCNKPVNAPEDPELTLSEYAIPGKEIYRLHDS